MYLLAGIIGLFVGMGVQKYIMRYQTWRANRLINELTGKADELVAANKILIYEVQKAKGEGPGRPFNMEHVMLGLDAAEKDLSGEYNA